MIALFERAVWLCGSLAAFALLLKLAKEGLLRRYGMFSVYLASHLVSSIVLSQIARNRNAYFITYFLFEALRWCLAVLISLDIYRRTLEHYPGIATVGRRLIAISSFTAVVLALSSVFLFRAADTGLLSSLLLWNRLGTLTVFFFLATMSLFLLWFPISLTRNAGDYVFGFSIYFLIKSVGLLAISLNGMPIASIVSTLILVSTAFCYLYWVVRLDRNGEITPVKTGVVWSLERERRLLQQLDDMNLALLRTTNR